MTYKTIASLMLLVFTGGAAKAAPLPKQAPGSEVPYYRAIEIFEPIDLHVHGSGIVELPNGDLLSCWFEGTGERWADDVLIKGARLSKGENAWSEPFVLADTPGFPDINPVLFLDQSKRLWLLWYTVQANLWETSLLKYRISTSCAMAEGPPEWDWQEVLHVKPGDSAERGIQPGDRFVESVKRKIAEYEKYLESMGLLKPGDERRSYWERRVARLIGRAAGQDLKDDGYLYREDGSYSVQEMGYPLSRRIGWQTYTKPVFLEDGRMVVPLYSDGFSFSLMAITDDEGKTWSFSEPLVGLGNIQPTIAQKKDGTLVAYMRDNGPPPKRLHVSRSSDQGQSWSPVRDTEILNPGSGSDIVTLRNGHWLLVHNDTERDRNSLAVIISTDEGKTWKWRRHLERDLRSEGATRSHYPAVIEAADGSLHVVYSHHYADQSGRRRTIKYAQFNEAWVRQGDSP